MNVNPTRFLSKDELIQKAIESLMAALGPIETTRFLTLDREERVDSVERHQRWQAGLDREAFFNHVFDG